MKKEKEFLRKKFVEFQLKIVELASSLRKERNSSLSREKDLFLDLLEILDAFDNLDETIKAKEGEFDKTAQRLAKNVRAIQKKFARLLKARHIVPIEFPDNKAAMDLCKIVDTQESADMKNETILSVIKKGYLDKQKEIILRKAEVITVLNERG